MNSFFPLISGSPDEKKYYLDMLHNSGMPKRRLAQIHKVLSDNRRQFVDIFIDSGQIIEHGKDAKSNKGNRCLAVFVTFGDKQLKEFHELNQLCDYIFMSDRLYLNQPTVGYIFNFKQARKPKPKNRR